MDIEKSINICSKKFCFKQVSKKEGSTHCSIHQREIFNAPIEKLIRKHKRIIRENITKIRIIQRGIFTLKILQEDSLRVNKELSEKYVEIAKIQEELEQQNIFLD